MQLQISPSAPTLKPLCPTRWTVRTAAFASVLQNYEVLCSALDEIPSSGTDEYAIKAAGFLSLMKKFNLYFGLKLSHPFLCKGAAFHLSAEKLFKSQFKLQDLLSTI